MFTFNEITLNKFIILGARFVAEFGHRKINCK